MSNNYQNWEDDDDFDFEEDDQPTQRNAKDPSTLIKQLRKTLREQEKRNKELEAQVSEYTSKRREDVIKEVLESKGVNPKVAKLIPSDVDATNADALNEWLDEYGDAFGIPQGEQPDLSGLKRINSATANAAQMTGVDDIDALINGAQSEEELYQILQQLG